jgi:hypothetical protein
VEYREWPGLEGISLYLDLIFSDVFQPRFVVVVRKKFDRPKELRVLLDLAIDVFAVQPFALQR